MIGELSQEKATMEKMLAGDRNLERNYFLGKAQNIGTPKTEGLRRKK